MHVLFGKNTFIVVHVIVRIRMHKIKLCEICLLFFKIDLNSIRAIVCQKEVWLKLTLETFLVFF